jgi:2-phosphosulfolactate phosphatase
LSPYTINIEVIIAPLLYSRRQIRENSAVVVVDIFRAGTTICVAFQSGAEKIIPVTSIEEAEGFKRKGFLVAGERGGVKLEFADFGNSPVELSQANLSGKVIVISSTNGTQALELAKGAEVIAIGAFTNLSFIAEWLLTLKRNVLILCSGWQETVSLEDFVFAGALTDTLLQGNRAFMLTDSAYTSIDLWNSVKADVGTYLQRGSHYQRLVKLGAQPDLDYAVRQNTTRVVPIFENYYLTNILK